MLRSVTSIMPLSIKSWWMILTGLWVLVVCLALCTGVYSPAPDGFDGYVSKANWMGYPIFWLLLLGLLQSSWGQFSSAWKALFLNGQVYVHNGKEDMPLAENEREQAYQNFQGNINGWRIYVIALAIIFSMVVMWVETGDLRKIYNLENQTSNQSIVFQLNKVTVEYNKGLQKKARLELDEHKVECLKESEGYIIVKNHVVRNIRSAINKDTIKLEFYAENKGTLYYGTSKDLGGICLFPVHLGTKIPKKAISLDRDWTEGWIWLNHNKPSKVSNYNFVFIAYIQQFLLIAIAFAALLNLLLHTSLFKYFEFCKVCKDKSWTLKLDATSNLHEFGLERWNQALNTTYWFIVPALAIPLISQTSQPIGTEDIGQYIIKACVPLLLILPMIITIIFRQQRVMNLWDEVRNDKSKVEAYHQQSLWPFDRNWASKLGIILAFIMLSYLFSREASYLSVFLM